MRSYKNISKTLFIEALNNIPPYGVNENDAETEVGVLMQDMKSICDSATPLTSGQGERKTVHWWSQEISMLRKRANHL